MCRICYVAGFGNGDKYCMHKDEGIQGAGTYGGFWQLYLTYGGAITTVEDCWGSRYLNIFKSEIKY